MVLQLEDFLPVYANITDGNFYQNLYDKYEFRELKLNTKQDTNFSDYLPSQKIVSRFLSPYTPYNNLLLYHEMGTGKTCAAVGVAENLKLHGYKKCIYISTGGGLHENFKNEVAYKCTKKNEYLKKNEATNTYKFDKKKFYEFYMCSTYQTFVNESPSNYNNCIFILDEVHNLVVKEYKDPESNYNKFHQFLHKVNNCKILLLSGTPITDKENTFTPIMNLILPTKDQIPDEDYNNLGVIKEKIKGYVSFLSSPKTDIRLDFIRSEIDDEIKPLQNTIPLYYETMSKFQSKKYLDLETASDPGAARLNERHVSLFADPIYENEQWEKDGIDYDGWNKLKANNYWQKFSKLFKKSKTIEQENLDILKKYSITYYNTVVNVLGALDEGKKIFIYNSFVNKYGVYLFAAILTEIFNIASKKILILTGNTLNEDANKKINEFNNSENDIKIILGSTIISEGFTFKNIEIIHVQTPAWNYSETMQVIARGYRVGSHDDLIKNGVKPEVEVYLHASIPDPDTANLELVNESIDVYMYKISAEKWAKAKLVEKIAKEAAIDCSLTQQRNEEAAAREDKNWSCAGNVELDNKIDFSTYIMYYADRVKEDIRFEIIDIFKDHSELTLQEIYDKIYENTVEEPFIDKNGKNAGMILILEILNDIIETNQVLTNNIGIMRFLRCEKDTYFCINNAFLNNDKLLSCYSASTGVFEYNTVNDWFESEKDKETIEKIDKLCTDFNADKTDQTLVGIYDSLEPNVKEAICSLAKYMPDSDFSKFVLKNFCVIKANEPQKKTNDDEAMKKRMKDVGITFYGKIKNNDLKIIWPAENDNDVSCKNLQKDTKDDNESIFCKENIIRQILNKGEAARQIVKDYLHDSEKKYKIIQVKNINKDTPDPGGKKERLNNRDPEEYILVKEEGDIPLFNFTSAGGRRKLTNTDVCKIIETYLTKNELIINPENNK